MRKSKLFIYVFGSLATIIFLTAILWNYPFLKGEKEFLAKVRFREYNVAMKFIKSSTSADFIQVTTQQDGKTEKVIKNIQDKNYLFGYCISSDSTLNLFVNSGGDPIYDKPDTVKVIIR